MTSFGKFTLRFAVYGIVMLYLVGDLLIFHGPLYQRVQASHLDSPESIAAARARGVVALVYGREITRTQIDHLVITRLALAGTTTLDALSPDQLRLHRYAALGDLIDHELLRVKVMHSTAEFEISDPQIDAAVARIAARFPDQAAFHQALKTDGTTPDAHRARIAARLNAELLNQGTPISITDVFIAATGLRHKWSVVTNNTKDFRRIDGLALEDWR